MKLFELYQETKGGSFTHDKQKYDINTVFRLVDKNPVSYFKVADIEWILAEDNDAARVKSADLNAPLLMTIWKRKWVVLDGVHRLQKAIDMEVEYLPGRIVSQEQLEESKVS